MKSLLLIAMLTSCSILAAPAFCQPQYPNINPQWDNYYNNYPSGIDRNFKSSDLIRILEKVGFVPASGTYNGNAAALQKTIVTMDDSLLKSLKANSDYLSRSYMHEDFFELYNSAYKKITRDEWDSMCPYLIALMKLDKKVEF